MELIISDAWWEMLVVGTLGGEPQMPLKPPFCFVRSRFFIHLWFL
jgi:hypothetical protein